MASTQENSVRLGERLEVIHQLTHPDSPDVWASFKIASIKRETCVICDTSCTPHHVGAAQDGSRNRSRRAVKPLLDPEHPITGR